MTVGSPESEVEMRMRLFARVEAQYRRTGRLTHVDLVRYETGEGFQGLISTARGIWNPQALSATLSVVSSMTGPYSDAWLENGLFRYSYQGTHAGGDNRKLRAAQDNNLPIVLFLKPVKNDYIPIWPVYVVGDSPDALEFLLDISRSRALAGDRTSGTERRYSKQEVLHRLHQPVFRNLVLTAYQTRCAICELRHPELLDAAHITADRDPDGLAMTSNGLSLCKIHHSSYDNDLLGITPDYTVRINQELLHEIDGPMLLHGLQEMHGRQLILPTRKADRPDRERLAARYREFLASS